MNTQPDPDQIYHRLNWLNRNRHIWQVYRYQYIAYNSNKLIAHSPDLNEVLELANASGEAFSIYLVPKNFASMQIL